MRRGGAELWCLEARWGGEVLFLVWDGSPMDRLIHLRTLMLLAIARSRYRAWSTTASHQRYWAEALHVPPFLHSPSIVPPGPYRFTTWSFIIGQLISKGL